MFFYTDALLCGWIEAFPPTIFALKKIVCAGIQKRCRESCLFPLFVSTSMVPRAVAGRICAP